MRIFQSEKQVTVSIRLNAFGELFSAGRALVSLQSLGVTLSASQRRDLKIKRSRMACQKLSSGIHVAPAPRIIAESITIATAAIARLAAQTTTMMAVVVIDDSLYIVLSFQESLLKAKGRLLPFIRNFEQKLIYISLME